MAHNNNNRVDDKKLVKQSLLKMQGDAKMNEAGRSVLLQLLEKLHKAEPVAREGSDPEGVHDMRVATRRLRAALKVLEETSFDPKVTSKLRGKLRGLANALGQSRDIDVMLDHLKDYSSKLTHDEQGDLAPFRKELEKQRENGRATMLKMLDSSKNEKLLDKLRKFAESEKAGLKSKPADKYEVAPSLVRHFASSAIWRRYEEVLAYETVINPETPVDVLHRLRVACKRLRYTLDFFGEAMPEGLKSLQKPLAALQDNLGQLHDNQVATDLCQTLLKQHSDNQALANYEKSRLADIARLRGEFGTKWQIMISKSYWRELGSMLGELTNTD